MRVLRAAERFETRADGMRTLHCFSFGAHFDPDNVAFGPLTVCNDEELEPGSGYEPHSHRDAEIVSWVVSGTLTHEDSEGGRQDVPAGCVQRLSAGAGVRHSERNHGADTAVRFVQMWLLPDDGADSEPTYGCGRPLVRPGQWTDVAGGRAQLGLRTARAVLRVAQPSAGEQLHLPPGELTHLYVTTGCVDVEGVGELCAGDSIRVTGRAPALRALRTGQLLAWELPAAQAIPQ